MEDTNSSYVHKTPFHLDVKLAISNSNTPTPLTAHTMAGKKGSSSVGTGAAAAIYTSVLAQITRELIVQSSEGKMKGMFSFIQGKSLEITYHAASLPLAEN